MHFKGCGMKFNLIRQDFIQMLKADLESSTTDIPIVLNAIQ